MLSRVKCAVFCASLLLLPLIAFAGSSRSPLGGIYSVKQTTEQGKTILVTISFRLFNRTDSEIKNATLMLADHQPVMPSKTPPTPGVMPPRFNNHGTVNLTAIGSREELVVKDAKFSVPALEYQQWKRGARPVFVVTYISKSGRVEAPIELVRMDGGAL